MKNVDDIYPLSPTQQGMLFHLLEAPDSALYLEHLSFTLHEHLDTSAFKQAWQHVVDRHPVLRTAFIWQDLDEPLQVVRSQVEMPWTQHDWRSLSPDEQQQHLKAHVQTDRQQRFKLDQAPLLRFTLIRLADDAHHFLWSFNHLLLDRWSVDLVLNEALAYYEALRDGRLLRLPPPPPYRDYIAWLQRRDHAQTFWRQALQGFTTPTLQVMAPPTGNRLEAGETYQARHLRFSSALTAGLQSLVRKHHLTLNTLMQGAWGLLLSRHSGEQDVVFGSTVTVRPPELPRVESMVGLFINTLPVRVRVEGKTQVLAWMQRLIAAQFASQQYAHSPLVEIQGWSEVPWGQALFESLVVFENIPVTAFSDKAGHSLRIEDVQGLGRTHYPLTLAVTPGRELSVRLSYQSDRFDEATIRRLLEHFRRLLEGIVANPLQPLSTLSLLIPEEQSHRQRPIQTTSPTKVFKAFRREEIEQTISDRFEQQVEVYPGHVAVCTRKHVWTYTELNREANHVAHVLLRQHGADEGRVGLLFNHDAPMIAALLGVLKAGKTYVPLDPHYPKARLTYIVSDTQVEAILTDTSNLDLAQELANDGLPLYHWETLERLGSVENPQLPIAPDRPAYILYTSGSTGYPKGVVQAHRNVLHFIRVYTNNLQIDAGDRLTVLPSFGFDAAVMDIFGALLNGATLYPWSIREEGLASLAAWINHQQITIFHSTPSVFRYFVGRLTEEQFPGIRLVVLGGEEAHRQDAERFKKHFAPGCHIVNGLGPTESTVSLQYFLDPHTERLRPSIPVGFPVEETEVLLLNENGEDAQVYGEIGIRSPYLALGYWRKPEATQAVFLPDPEGGSRRIFRTGDLARRLPDGSLEYIGRRDTQVKLRGFRIELREIEVILEEHPAVQMCVVLANQNQLGERFLVAFVVSWQGQALLPDALRRFLQKRLPAYMVPTAFVFLEALPLTPNGKVDRRSLPSPEDALPEIEATYVAPRNQTERVLAAIWSDVLKVERVGIHDNFFDLGGHSLLAMQIMARMHAELGAELSLQELFEAPTVAHLATHLRRDLAPSSSWHWLVPLRAEGSGVALFFVHGVSGSVFGFRDLVERLSPGRPLYGLQGQGLKGEPITFDSVEAIAAAYVEEVCRFYPEGPYLLTAYCAGGTIALEMARLLEQQGREVALLSIIDFLEPGVRARVLGTPGQRAANRVQTIRRKGLAYLKEWSLRHMRYRLRRGAVRLRKSLARVYGTLGRPIPAALRGNYIIETYTQVLLGHRPSPYGGALTLFTTADSLGRHGADLGWSRVVRGGVQVHVLPGGHADLLRNEPSLSQLAKHLDEAIHDVLTP